MDSSSFPLFFFAIIGVVKRTRKVGDRRKNEYQLTECVMLASDGGVGSCNLKTAYTNWRGRMDGRKCRVVFVPLADWNFHWGGERGEVGELERFKGVNGG